MFLGIEIGGTKLQFGLGPGDGTLAALVRGPIEPRDGAEGIRRQIVQAVPRLLDQASIPRSTLRGIGVGFGGPVDDATNRVIKSHQIEGWDDFPLAEWIGELIGLPAVLGNDADVAGLAEAHFGAGRGMSPIFYITIGSGIGGGLIINGDIHRGGGRGAAEIGHLRSHTLSASDGRRLILEEIASGWSIETAARRQGSQQRSPRLHELLGGDWIKLTVRHLAQAAAENDPFALSILQTAWEALAEAICDVIALVCPLRFVIGGGVSLVGEKVLFEPLRRLVAERVFIPFAGCYDIVPAILGEEVVVHGALALARQRSAR